MRLRHLLAFALGFILPAAAQGQPIELKLAHNSGQGSLFDICAQEYARRVNAKLGGRYLVTVYGQSKLGNDNQTMAKVRSGEVALTLVSTVMSSVSDDFGVFEMPFLIRDRDQIKRFRAAVFQGFLKPAARAKGYLLLAMWENGFRHITSNVKPVDTPADLRGMRLRVPPGDWRAKMFKSYGASTLEIAFDQVHDALQNHAIDAQENPLAQIDGGKFYEVQKYLTLSWHVYTPAYLVGSPEQFAKLPPDVAETLIAVARDMEDWVLEQGERLDRKLLDKMRLYMRINEADPLAFTLASLAIYREYIQSVPDGRRLVKLIFDAAPIETSRIAEAGRMKQNPKTPGTPASAPPLQVP